VLLRSRVLKPPKATAVAAELPASRSLEPSCVAGTDPARGRAFHHPMKELQTVFTKADWMILIAAFVSFLFSISLWFGVGGEANKDAGIFVGIWVPSILAAGNYVRSASKAVRRE